MQQLKNKTLFLIILLLSIVIIMTNQNLKSENKDNLSCNAILDEIQKIVVKKDVTKLAQHISPDGIEMIATKKREKLSKAKVLNYLNAEEINFIKDFFFSDLPAEFKEIAVDALEENKGCYFDSTLRGKGLQLKIKKENNNWYIISIGYTN